MTHTGALTAINFTGMKRMRLETTNAAGFQQMVPSVLEGLYRREREVLGGGLTGSIMMGAVPNIGPRRYDPEWNQAEMRERRRLEEIERAALLGGGALSLESVERYLESGPLDRQLTGHEQKGEDVVLGRERTKVEEALRAAKYRKPETFQIEAPAVISPELKTAIDRARGSELDVVRELRFAFTVPKLTNARTAQDNTFLEELLSKKVSRSPKTVPTRSIVVYVEGKPKYELSKRELEQKEILAESRVVERTAGGPAPREPDPQLFYGMKSWEI